MIFLKVRNNSRTRCIALPPERRIDTPRGTLRIDALRVGDHVRGGFVRGEVIERWEGD